MAETMTALVERHRAYKAALTAGCKTDWSREVEAAFYATADTEAGDIIETDPPRLRDHADLVAAISYVAEDVDFLQEGHARVLARAVEYLTETGPEPDPLLVLIEAYRAGVAIQNAIPDDEWDERAAAVEAEHIKPHHARLETDPPSATSLAGVMAALQLVADENDIGDTPDLTAAVSRAALAYFRRAA